MSYIRLEKILNDIIEEKNIWNVHAICEGMVKSKDGTETWKNYKFKITKEMVEWFSQK